MVMRSGDVVQVAVARLSGVWMPALEAKMDALWIRSSAVALIRAVDPVAADPA
jgi:hypothetical protein